MTFAATGIMIAALLGGCGSSTSSTTTTNAQLRERQDALVAFFNAVIADLPIRASARKAAAQFRSNIEMQPPDLSAAEHALREALSDAVSWHRAMESLPAADTDLRPSSADYTEAAADEVKELRAYLAAMHAIATGGSTSTELLRRAEAFTAKAESLDIAAKKRLAIALGPLGGEAFLRRRIGVKRLQEAAQNGLQETATASPAH
jgi:hypothetical protein